MTKVTEYTYKGRTFIICKADSGYWAFENTDIDADGRLTKAHNGITGHYADKIADTLRRVKQKVDCDEYRAAGYTDMEAAMLAVIGYLPESVKG